MHFDTAFLLAEFRPPKYGKAQINGCRIESIYVSTKFKDVSGTLMPCFAYEVVGILFKDVGLS